MARRLTAVPLPLALLVVISLLSFGARVALIGQPCRSPCQSASDHLLVFDEVYYVNAARVIAGQRPAANEKYASAPLGEDPNAEHPQLAKLLIAGSIQLLGDDPFAWRLPSLLFGSLAILAMFAVIRASGGDRWPAFAGAALMATDNLLLVHSRIATLDVPALTLMLLGVALYLRGRLIAAGAAIGVGACIKLVAPYALFVIVLLELLRGLAGPERAGHAGDAIRALAVRLRAAGVCAISAALTFLALLALLDRIAQPFDDAAGKALGYSPFRHLAHMLHYGANQTSPHGPQGIASYPWTWLVDYKPITYLNINPARPAGGLSEVHPAAHFLGMISPAVMLLALPALAALAWGISSRRRPQPTGTGILALAWFLGTFLPFVVLSTVFERTSYLYYMVVVMPGIYVAIGCLLVRFRAHRRLILLWIVLLTASVIVMYPFTPLL